MQRNWYRHALSGKVAGQESPIEGAEQAANFQAQYGLNGTPTVGQGIPAAAGQNAIMNLVPEMAKRLNSMIAPTYNNLLNQCTDFIVTNYGPMKEDIAKMLAEQIIRTWSPAGTSSIMNQMGQIEQIVQSNITG